MQRIIYDHDEFRYDNITLFNMYYLHRLAPSTLIFDIEKINNSLVASQVVIAQYVKANQDLQKQVNFLQEKIPTILYITSSKSSAIIAPSID